MSVSEQMSKLFDKFQDLESRIEKDLEAQRKEFRYVIYKRRVKFDASVRQQHKTMRKTIRRFLSDSTILAALVSPLVYLVIFPLLVLDLMLFAFQLICAPVYGIPKVQRSDYVVLDRHNLAYLNPIEKLNCVYCGYANGLLSYARAIAGRAEVHWCPIKHALKVKGAHRQYYDFAEYGDADGYVDQKNPTPPSDDKDVK